MGCGHVPWRNTPHAVAEGPLRSANKQNDKKSELRISLKQQFITTIIGKIIIVRCICSIWGMVYLASQLVILLLLLGLESVPPLAEDLADGAVVLVGVAPVHEGAVPLAEDHEGVHGAADARVLLENHQTNNIIKIFWAGTGKCDYLKRTSKICEI